jgi:two-component system cell cycle sensor histidine kinase/response regulator CckA
MKSKFKILHLEDSEADCELVRALLTNDGIDCDVRQCESRESFIEDLKEKHFDLIFADCTLPQFSGLHALELARQYSPGIPFIFVSGTIEEDAAIESLRRGATDYVLKSRLSRLVPAVRRALAETEEKSKSLEMEQRLRQAQRLEAVGTLAGGIAHDFNNILTIIRGYTSLLSIESGKPERVADIAATIDRASVRGAELVGQLLAFARKSEGTFSSTSINQRVQEVAAMLRPALPQNIVFESHLDESLPEISADAGQVERVLINLATNSRDAMPNGGKIIFSTSQERSERVPIHSSPEAQTYLCLRVSDTGTGMDEEIRQRVFEPFFTTKARGKGTGLGMPVVYGLMQSHGGFVDIQSQVGVGTIVSLYFPIPSGPIRHEIERPSDSPEAIGGTETVLVVDDESDVRYFVELILSLHGYRVLSAADADAGLSLLAADEVHLVFSDVGLPRMDGFELLRRARQSHPSIATILCSGYSDAKLKGRMAEVGIDGFIPKPYDANTLLRVVRSALDKNKDKLIQHSLF